MQRRCSLCSSELVVVSRQQRRADEAPTISSVCPRCGSLSSVLSDLAAAFRSDGEVRSANTLNVSTHRRETSDLALVSHQTVDVEVIVSARILARMIAMSAENVELGSMQASD